MTDGEVNELGQCDRHLSEQSVFRPCCFFGAVGLFRASFSLVIGLNG